jgi:hypothetical protein
MRFKPEDALVDLTYAIFGVSVEGGLGGEGGGVGGAGGGLMSL